MLPAQDQASASERPKMQKEVQELQDALLEAENLILKFTRCLKYKQVEGEDGYCRSSVEKLTEEGKLNQALLNQLARTVRASAPLLRHP